MSRYICKDCNYRFNAEKLIDCGYCGKNNIEMEKNAEELLDEIDKLIGG
mgnify:FL=1